VLKVKTPFLTNISLIQPVPHMCDGRPALDASICSLAITLLWAAFQARIA
jgi:hypothetical protein